MKHVESERLAQRSVAVQLFGPIEVEEGDRRLGPRDFGGIRPKQVLEILLAARGHWVPVDRLAELMWGEELPDNPAASLHTFVSVLRRHLSADRDRARKLVVTEPDGYRFGVEDATIDLDQFDELLGEAGRAPTELALRRLREALSLVRGVVLEDEPYADWTQDLRGTYLGRVLGASLDAAEAALAGRDYRAGLGYAEDAVGLDRFSERAHRLRMLALYAMDRAHEALEGYRLFRALLDEELGLRPAAESRALHEAILRQEDVETLLPRAVGPSGAVGKPWLRFLGREQELSRLQQVLERSRSGVFSVALVEGEAGLGKSRLLDEFAATLQGVRVGRARCTVFEERLRYVPLADALRGALADVDLEGAGLPGLSRVFPELAPSSPVQAAEDLTALEGTAELIRRHAPLVLILDDLHHADAGTLAALPYLRRRCTDVPAMLVATIQVESMGPDHRLRRLPVDDLVRLEPLTAADLSPLGILELHERTAGWPELVSHLVADAPGPDLHRAVSELLIARCRAEGPDSYRILLTAAALEQPFDPELLATVLDLDSSDLVERLDGFCDRRLLRVDGMRFRYRYGLARDALVASLSPARRRLIEARARAARQLGVIADGGSRTRRPVAKL